MKLLNKKHETRNKVEKRKKKYETERVSCLSFPIFGFVSVFGLRISDFQPEVASAW